MELCGKNPVNMLKAIFTVYKSIVPKEVDRMRSNKKSNAKKVKGLPVNEIGEGYDILGLKGYLFFL